ncbi:cache domain-containing sensor histidine kinase [Sediminispirochaeta smaragdinae]|uniref:histidine kinase n=1 Tax=Sediminispirochaeta smaragdinae (strain DSM 11293 / JCM 15392 / SEBR 4228) TaxID=573413 RepID=E1R2E1_SEDSS|nr:histidine kinase [Sediminispirochaeta smaragdinae]ADK82501.1 integral membrane sensor signal transduction histidine kinase [Sediminispirochaeta smaragdinae DSM 11293]
MKSRTILLRLTLSYFLTILLIILLISAVITAIFSSQIKENAVNQMDVRISRISGDIEEQLLQIIRGCDEVKNNPYIIKLLTGVAMEEKNADALLKDYAAGISGTGLVGRMVLINRNMEILDGVYRRIVYSKAILQSEDFSRFLTGHYVYYFSPPETFPETMPHGDGDQPHLILYQRLLDDNYFLMGYLVSVLRKGILFQTIFQQNRDRLFTSLGIVDNHGTVIYRTGKLLDDPQVAERVGRISGESPVSLKIGSERYLTFVRPVQLVHWSVVGFVPYQRLNHNLRLALFYILILGLAFIAFAFLISYSVASAITRPLSALTSAMHAYDSEQVLKPIDIKAEGEIAYLVSVYNRLVNSVNESIRNIYHEQEEKKEAELRSIQYELDFLQAQINPHFIHNTLNAIGSQAEEAGNMEIYESLKSFNALLRAVLGGMEDLIPLEEECHLVERYSTILHLRYGNSFRLETDLSEECGTALVPRLILQPIVENALFHGIGVTAEREGVILLSSRREGDHLLLSVSDDGKGMNREELERCKNSSADKGHFNRIGIGNIRERLAILYGENGRLDIQSREHEGTRVVIVIPWECEDE